MDEKLTVCRIEVVSRVAWVASLSEHVEGPVCENDVPGYPLGLVFRALEDAHRRVKQDMLADKHFYSL